MNDDECNKVVQNMKPLFSLHKGKRHYISIGNSDLYDLFMTMNDNLTKLHSENDFCILSLLNSKPKCIFNVENSCDCDKCIQQWMNSIE